MPKPTSRPGREGDSGALRLVVTHEQPDFDALASLALARLAHPGSVAVVTGNLTEPVRNFVHLYRDRLDLQDVNRVDPERVGELIVVDTNDPTRIAPFDQLLGRVPVTLYDHHPRMEGGIRAARGVQEQVGATVTLLTRHLRSSGVAIPPATASLALLGLHEDTGNLSYPSTTADDYEAAAYLIRSGADLGLVTQFTRNPFDEEQRDFLHTTLDHAHLQTRCGRQLVVSSFEYPTYLPGIAIAANQLLELYGTDAALLAVGMEGKTLVVARVFRGFDAGAALRESFGGGGHPGAAFARTEEPPGRAAELALAAFERHCYAPVRARDVMTREVKTVRSSATVADAQRLLASFGHNGAPVLDDNGELVGVISRRDLERALRHDLGHAGVTGFMARDVITAPPEATLMELEQLITSRNIGRIPITQGGELLGIVTRTDLLESRHRQRETPRGEQVLGRLPNEALAAVETAAELLGDAALYLVGGTVRDALLGRALTDLDLVVEGVPAAEVATRLQRELGGQLAYHAAFGTSTLSLPGGLVLDIATAREETYEHPGALPNVTPSSLRKDLARRDFTVNALAVRVHPGPVELIDPYHGQADLERKLLRVLHPLSFVEDPTRILRGARLAGRLGFRFESVTRERAREALASDVIDQLSHSRLRAELELTFAEERVAPAARTLQALGALERIYGLSPAPALFEALDDLRAAGPVPDEAYLLALLLRTPAGAAEAHLEAFHWPHRLAGARERLAAVEGAGEASEELLGRATPAERAVIKALSPRLKGRVEAFETAPHRRKLRGRDVLELGLPPGPAVGEILAAVANARQQGRAETFEAELELARALVAELADPPHGE